MSGWLLLLAGCMILLHLSLPLAIRAPAVVLWLADGGCQIARQASGHAAVRAVRLVSALEAEILERSGKVERCRVSRGSLMTAGFCWLRLERRSGTCHGEWLSARSVGPEAWRRLQIAWRWGPASSE